MNVWNFPWAGERPHNWVGVDGSMRVWDGIWQMRRVLSDAEIAETARGQRPHIILELTDEVRQACQSMYPN